jgi:Methylase involved in ubiquinone/menaquinone biosynthesis
MQNFNSTEEQKQQYETDKNLNARVALHQRFSTNKQGWMNWVFQNYDLKPGMRILELGCGNGMIWQEKADKLPPNLSLCLSDFSQGMSNSARKNTDSLDFIDYKVIDAQEIPFENDNFDVVIANHMLYHVPDTGKALKEISRVLRPEGTFYATTIGSGNFKEMIEILQNFDENIDFAQDGIVNAFGLQTGENRLGEFFDSVQVRKYEDSLHITEPEPFIAYVLSSQGIGNINDIILGERSQEFTEYILSLFAQKGCVDVYKEAGIFVSKLPKKCFETV